MNALREAWLEFELEEFPPACLGRTVNGRTWEQADAVAAGCIAMLTETGALDGECRALLEGAILDLAEMAALAEEEDRAYFTRLLELARQALDAAPPTGPAPASSEKPA